MHYKTFDEVLRNSKIAGYSWWIFRWTYFRLRKIKNLKIGLYHGPRFGRYNCNSISFRKSQKDLGCHFVRSLGFHFKRSKNLTFTAPLLLSDRVFPIDRAGDRSKQLEIYKRVFHFKPQRSLGNLTGLQPLGFHSPGSFNAAWVPAVDLDAQLRASFQEPIQHSINHRHNLCISHKR